MFLIVEVSWAHIFTRYYFAPNAEMTVDSLGHTSHLYYAGDDSYTSHAVMVIDENEFSNIYHISRDNIGSAIHYENSDGVCYQNSYSPWGVRTYIGESTVFYQPGEEPGYGPFYRTYTGHEDLWMFGLINANARLYSPYLGRFVSPDPLLNSEGGVLDYNPYIYARNNPYKYIDRNGEFWWLAPILISAAINATTYSITAAISGNWNVGDFFKSMGMGAVTGTLGVGTSLLGTSLGSFGNNFAYGLLSNMVNNTATNAIFGDGLSFGDIPGMIIGASVGTLLPYYSPSGTDVFKNVVSEIGINTFRGAVTGFSSGAINAMVHDDPSLVWKGAAGGAISGGVRTAMHNAIFGAGYQPQDENGKPVSYGDDGIYRKGGVAGFVMNSLNGGGCGVTLGRYVFTVEKGESMESVMDTRYHENIHLQQIHRLGLTRFYGEIFRQYVKYGFGIGPLEQEAYQNQRNWIRR